ncbi:hypothetical protein VTK26DRAFT_3818 [Humicola hyalothermophila]
MCTVGFATFSCGCRKAIAHTLRLCEYARLKGMACPDFQVVEDPSESKAIYYSPAPPPPPPLAAGVSAAPPYAAGVGAP